MPLKSGGPLKHEGDLVGLCVTQASEGKPECSAGLGPGPPRGLYYEALQSSLIPHTFARMHARICVWLLPHMLLHVSSCVSNDPPPQHKTGANWKTNKA